jgi:hypothetical protein
MSGILAIENLLWFIMSDRDSETDSNVQSVADNVTDNGKRRRNQSEVWQYFNKTDWKSKKMKMATCAVSGCQHKQFSCGNVGTTRPLWRHLEQAHRSVYMLTGDYRQKQVKEFAGEGGENKDKQDNKEKV